MSAKPTQASEAAEATAPIPTVDYLLTGLSSWLIPGAGHWLLGHRLRGVILAGGILGLFWYGESALGDNMAVSRQVSPIFFVCQIGNGLSTLVAENAWGEPVNGVDSRKPDRDLPKRYHLAILCTTIAGLLNWLAVLHVFDPRTWTLARRSARGNTPRPPGGDQT